MKGKPRIFYKNNPCGAANTQPCLRPLLSRRKHPSHNPGETVSPEHERLHWFDRKIEIPNTGQSARKTQSQANRGARSVQGNAS
jgi:hypothetical protein